MRVAVTDSNSKIDLCIHMYICPHIHMCMHILMYIFAYSHLHFDFQVKDACGGDLKRVKKVVKLVGFVNSEDTFTDQPKVRNVSHL